jgi:hypothetical protein
MVVMAAIGMDTTTVTGTVIMMDTMDTHLITTITTVMTTTHTITDTGVVEQAEAGQAMEEAHQ